MQCDEERRKTVRAERQRLVEDADHVESPFRPGSDYDKLFRLGRRKPALPRHEFIRVAARMLRKRQSCIRYDLQVLANENSRSNRHQCRLDKNAARAGKVAFVRV